MIDFPHAKINLGLQVINKRPDGFHTISTLFYPIPFNDVLEIVPAQSTALHLSGLKVEGNVDDNLCLKAYHLLAQKYTLPPVDIYLHKNIAMGAGLGGGSSDASHVLLLLNNMFKLNLPAHELMQYAAQLGSDCAFFIQQQAMFAGGRGEILQPSTLSLKGYSLLLVVPGIHVSTAGAYSGITPQTPTQSIQEIVALPVSEWKDRLVNDFEATVFSKHAVLADIKAALYAQGAVYAAMSGSGSSIFGLFIEDEACKKAQERLSKNITTILHFNLR